MNYYNKIKNHLIDVEINNKVKDYSKNKYQLEKYYEIGRLLIEAQGGEKRAKYGDNLIKEYSKRLTKELGKGYSTRSLKRMRKFYLFQKGTPVVTQSINWSHFIILLTLHNVDEINYYISQIINNHWSKRTLQEHIKNKDYQRLPVETKNKLINKEKLNIYDNIKNPIIINTYNSFDKENIEEKILKTFILRDMDNFLRQLGDGFTYMANEYKIMIGNKPNYIDLLLYNVLFNCYVVVELKVTNSKKDHLGQIQVYMNYIDKHIRRINQNKTIGIIVCKKDDKYLIEYSSDDRIKITTYKLV